MKIPLQKGVNPVLRLPRMLARSSWTSTARPSPQVRGNAKHHCKGSDIGRAISAFGLWLPAAASHYDKLGTELRRSALHESWGNDSRLALTMKTQKRSRISLFARPRRIVSIPCQQLFSVPFSSLAPVREINFLARLQTRRRDELGTVDRWRLHGIIDGKCTSF